MDLFPLFVGASLVIAGSAGLLITSRVNGSVLAGYRSMTPEQRVGLAPETDDDFSYVGRVDHRVGAKRRILATFLLILLIGAVGVLLAGGVILVFRAIWSTVSKLLPAA